MTDKTKRICIWSGPRNISTALMYSFAQRNDTSVFDEPLYAYYLCNSKARAYHPGADEIIASQENDGSKVIETMMGKQESPIAFFKHMTHHLLDLDRSFMKDLTNVILTRNPNEMLPSFDKVIQNPTMTDVGYEAHIDLLGDLLNMNIEPIVIDSKRLLLDPESFLKKLCAKLEIEYNEKMIKWNPGARKEDGTWAKYWYTSVHNSNGFMPYKEQSESFPGHLKPLLSDCLPLYLDLMKYAL